MRSNAVVSRELIAVCCAGMAGIGMTAVVAPSTLVFAADNGPSRRAFPGSERTAEGQDSSDVTVSAQDGTATLSGEVNLFAYKAQAIKQAEKTKGIEDVRDNIAVGGPTIRITCWNKFC